MTSVLKTLQGNSYSLPPIWLMRQAGRYLPEYRAIRKKIPAFMDLCFHEDLATEVTLQPIRKFDFDAAILFSDILTIPHVLGQTVHIKETLGPVLEPIENTQIFETAKTINIHEAFAIPLKVINNVRRSLPQSKTVIGFSGSPWTIATYMLEGGKSVSFEKILYMLKDEDSLFIQTMAILEDVIGDYLIAQIQAGADVVQIFDTWAKAVPQDLHQRWIIEPVQRIIQRIQIVYPDTPIIYYGRGVSSIYQNIASDFENIAFSVDETVPVSVIKHQIQSLGPIQGNLCPRVLVKGGEMMKQKVTELLEAFRETPYVFNLGHGIVPQTPVDHVTQLVDLVREGRIVR